MSRYVTYSLLLLAFYLGYMGVSLALDITGLIAPNSTKTYRIVIIPVCNPGTSCDPKLKTYLSHLFFRHPSGVARHIKKAFHGKIGITGVVTPWLRSPYKIKSYHDILDGLPTLLSLTGTSLKIAEFDIVLIYIKTPGHQHNIGWPPGQIFVVNDKELSPGLGLMINSPLYAISDAQKRDSSILPSTSWASVVLHILGINNPMSQVCM